MSATHRWNRITEKLQPVEVKPVQVTVLEETFDVSDVEEFNDEPTITISRESMQELMGEQMSRQFKEQDES